MAVRELPGIFDARRINGQQRVYKPALTAESGQHGEIDVQRDARFAPSLHRKPADEAGAPALTAAENLQLPGRLEEIDHRGSFAEPLLHLDESRGRSERCRRQRVIESTLQQR